MMSTTKFQLLCKLTDIKYLNLLNITWMFTTVHKTKGQMQNHSIDELYDVIRNGHQAAPVQLTIDVQHPCLKPRLRPYQEEAVLWMLHREKLGQDQQERTATAGKGSSIN